jgi:hypothetical protein
MEHMLQMDAELGITAYDAELGWPSLNPFKAVKSVAKGVGKVGKAVGKGAVRYVAKPALKATLAPAVLVKDVATGKNVLKSTGKFLKSTAAPVLTPAAAIGNLALTPVRNKVRTMVNRRAAKLAFDRRRSKQPTAGETTEARGWAKAKLRKSGPHGLILAALAGPPEMWSAHTVLTGPFGEPITTATVAASVPILLAVVNALIKKSAASGEAPADPAATAVQAAAQAIQQQIAPQEPVQVIQQEAVYQETPQGPGATEVYEDTSQALTTEEVMQGAADTIRPAAYVLGGLGLAAIIVGVIGVARS